ncbi:MAG: CBS domain-containing protein [Pirellulaceae bacterium]
MNAALSKTTKIRDVMTRGVVTINEDDAIHSALDLMVEHRVSALPVVDKKNHCIGILSSTDLTDLTKAVDLTFDEGDGDSQDHFWASAIIRDHFGAEMVSTLMTKDVAVISMEATVQDAARAMLRDRVHHIPVVDDHNKLHGIVSSFDLVKVLAD